jgi:hypothetical protein
MSASDLASLVQDRKGSLGDPSIELSTAFSDRVSSVPTADWTTYTSRFGYKVKYPPDWTVFSCANGAQVFFYDAKVSDTCDGPNEGAAFSILGPISPEELTIQTNPARLIEVFSLNGIKATRYVDAVGGPSGYDLVELVQLEIDDRHFAILFNNLSRTIWQERILTTFDVAF